MISKLKNKISEIVAVKKFARNQNLEKSFKQFFSNSTDVLIILPRDVNILSLEVVELIRFIAIHKKKLFLIHKMELQEYLPKDYEFASLIIRETDKTKILGLPNSDLIKTLKNRTFDLVFDLNTKDDLFSSALSNIPLADFRIGFIKNKSDLFYNYQIPSEINSEKSHRNLVNSLRMF